MAQIRLTPDQLKEIADRFAQHHHDIEHIVKSVNSDMELLSLFSAGSHWDETTLREIIPILQKSSDTFRNFSNMFQEILNSICIPDEFIGENLFY